MRQQALREVLSERDFLLNCLGTNMTEELEKSVSGALSETPAVETLTKHLVSLSSTHSSISQCSNVNNVNMFLLIFPINSMCSTGQSWSL